MSPERLNYWAEIFDGKALEYDFKAATMLQDQQFVDDLGEDVAKGFAEEERRKAARAREIVERLRKQISN